MGAPQYEQAGADIGGTGTTNTIPRWTGPSTLGDSGLIDNGTAIYTTTRNVGIGTATPQNLLQLGAAAVFAQDTNTLYTGSNFTGSAAGNFIGSAWAVQQYFDRASGVIGFRRSSASGTAGNAISWLESARIDSAGRFLVGTSTAPSSNSVKSVIASSGGVYAGIQNTGANVGCAFGVSSNFEIYTTSGAYGSEAYTQRMAISSSGAAAASQVAIGTGSFTSGRALTTVADLDVFGVRVGRGANTSSTANAVLGNTALDTGTSADYATAIGAQAIQRHNGAENTGVGYLAHRGSTTLANNTGGANTAVGSQALTAISSGGNNVALGQKAGSSITTGASNIIIGAGADVAAAGDSNQFVLGDATNYVATNGGATTYYATAGASLGYMRVRLNGTYVKIEVFADV